MPRSSKWPEDTNARLQPYLRSVTTAEELRRLLCVWLSARLRLTVNDIAIATGLTPASVRRIQRRFLHTDIGYLKSQPRGGRRHSNLTPDEERDLLRPFLFRAQRGIAVDFTILKNAYERRVGHQVPKSTIYRLLIKHHASAIIRRRHQGN